MVPARRLAQSVCMTIVELVMFTRIDLLARFARSCVTFIASTVVDSEILCLVIQNGSVELTILHHLHSIEALSMLMATITFCGIQTEILQLALAAVASKVWRHALTRVDSRTSLFANGIGTAFATAWQFAIVDFYTVTNRTSTRISSVTAAVICSGSCNNTCCVVNMAATIVLQTRIDGCADA